MRGSGENLHWRSNKINLDRDVRGAGGYTSTEGLLHSIYTCNISYIRKAFTIWIGTNRAVANTRYSRELRVTVMRAFNMLHFLRLIHYEDTPQSTGNRTRIRIPKPNP